MVTLRALALGAVLASLLAVAVPPAQAARARCRRIKSAKFTFSLIVNPYNPLTTEPSGVNDAGIIVGVYNDPSAVSQPSRGYLAAPPYSGENFTREDYPGSNLTVTYGINNRNNTAGAWSDAAGKYSGYVRIAGTFTSFSHPKATGNRTLFYSINDADVVSGLYREATNTVPSGFRRHAFLWNVRTGAITAIEPPNSLTHVIATSVNNMGAVTVYSYNDTSAASFLLKSGIYYPVAFPGGTYTIAAGVNDLDEVVGNYVDEYGVSHGFIGRRLTTRCPVYETLDVPIPNSTTTWELNTNGYIVGAASLPQDILLGLLATKVKA